MNILPSMRGSVEDDVVTSSSGSYKTCQSQPLYLSSESPCRPSSPVSTLRASASGSRIQRLIYDHLINAFLRGLTFTATNTTPSDYTAEIDAIIESANRAFEEAREDEERRKRGRRFVDVLLEYWKLEEEAKCEHGDSLQRLERILIHAKKDMSESTKVGVAEQSMALHRSLEEMDHEMEDSSFMRVVDKLRFGRDGSNLSELLSSTGGSPALRRDSDETVKHDEQMDHVSHVSLGTATCQEPNTVEPIQPDSCQEQEIVEPIPAEEPQESPMKCLTEEEAAMWDQWLSKFEQELEQTPDLSSMKEASNAPLDDQVTNQASPEGLPMTSDARISYPVPQLELSPFPLSSRSAIQAWVHETLPSPHSKPPSRHQPIRHHHKSVQRKHASPSSIHSSCRLQSRSRSRSRPYARNQRAATPSSSVVASGKVVHWADDMVQVATISPISSVAGSSEPSPALSNLKAWVNEGEATPSPVTSKGMAGRIGCRVREAGKVSPAYGIGRGRRDSRKGKNRRGRT